MRGCHPRQSQDCNCHELSRLMLLSESPQTVREVAKTSNVPEQTLYTHWPKKCLSLLEIIALRFDTQVIEWLQSEEARCLSDCHPAELAAGNCLDLAKRLLLSQPPELMGAIARDLMIKESALAQHWKTQCLPKLKKYRL